MLEILKFATDSVWHFLASIALILAIGVAIHGFKPIKIKFDKDILMADLNPETIAQARGRGDKTLIFNCSNGRENGPYDLNDFAVWRRGQRVAPTSITITAQTITATFAELLQLGDALN